MEIVYLSNGRACYLKEKIGDKYIVNKIFEHEMFYGEDSELVEVVDENDIVVDKIFTAPPVAKFSDEIIKLTNTKEALTSEVQLLISQKNKLTGEIENFKRTQITNNKFILNKTDLINAKTLALFAKDSIMPKVLDNKDKNFRGLKVSMVMEISSNEERYWGYKLYFDDGYSSGDFLCTKYGILINPTENEIEETIKKRLIEFEFDDYKIASVDDRYLTPSEIEIKNIYLANEKRKQKDELDRQLKVIQEKINNL